jgi:hypothetical protein
LTNTQPGAILDGHDIAVLPRLIRPFVADTLPDAVVQPENEAGLAHLTKWAAAIPAARRRM